MINAMQKRAQPGYPRGILTHNRPRFIERMAGIPSAKSTSIRRRIVASTVLAFSKTKIRPQI